MIKRLFGHPLLFMPRGSTPIIPQRTRIRKVRKRGLSVGVLKDRTRNVMMLLKNRNDCRCRKSSYICNVKWCRKAIGNHG